MVPQMDFGRSVQYFNQKLVLHFCKVFSEWILSHMAEKEGGVGGLSFNPNEETEVHRGERTSPGSLQSPLPSPRRTKALLFLLGQAVSLV